MIWYRYFALICCGSDGLNTEEIIRFLRVGRHMGVSENELNNLLVMYFQECNLNASFRKNILGQVGSNKIQSKL